MHKNFAKLKKKQYFCKNFNEKYIRYNNVNLRILVISALVFGTAIVFASGSMTVGDDFVSDLSQNASGKGWTWDAKTSTLKLVDGYGNGAINILSGYGDNIHINYAGNFSISGGSASAVFCSGSLEISGTGALSLESYNEAVIATMSDLTIKSGNVIINALNNGEHAIGCMRKLFIGGDAIVEANVTEGEGGGIYAGASISIADNAKITVVSAGDFHGISAVNDITVSTNATISVAVSGSGTPLVSQTGKIIVAKGTVNLLKPNVTEIAELTSGIVEISGGTINN